MYDWFMIMSLECACVGISRDFIVYKGEELESVRTIILTDTLIRF